MFFAYRLQRDSIESLSTFCRARRYSLSGLAVETRFPAEGIQLNLAGRNSGKYPDHRFPYSMKRVLDNCIQRTVTSAHGR